MSVLPTPRRRARPLLLATCAVVLLAAAGCGGASPEETLDKAFSQRIESANVSMDLNAQLNGLPQAQGPVRLTLKGPFSSNGNNKLPSLDWDATVSGSGQSVSAGIVSTGDNAFVTFQNTAYEIGTDAIAQLNMQAEGQQERSLADFGVNPSTWVLEPESQDDEEVAGTDSTHVSGRLDVAKMLMDLNKIAQSPQARSQLPPGRAAPPTLTDEQVAQVKQAVKEPTIDVFAAKDDGALRRLRTKVDFEVPAAQRQQAGGLQSGTVSFSIEFANVGEDQQIAAPPNPRPITELLQQFGLSPDALPGVTPGG